MKFFLIALFCSVQLVLCLAAGIPKQDNNAGTTAAFDEIRNTQARAREVAAERETVTNNFRRISMESINIQMNLIVENFIASHQELRYMYEYVLEFGNRENQSSCIDDLLFENEYIAFVYENEFIVCTNQFDDDFTSATQTYNDMLEQSIRRGTIAMQALTITEISKTTGFIREPANALNYFNERLYRYIGDWNSYYSILLQTGLTRMQENINSAGQTVDTCMRKVIDHMSINANDILYRMIACEPDV